LKYQITMNPDIKKEREQRTFDPKNITYQLFGKDVMNLRQIACK